MFDRFPVPFPIPPPQAVVALLRKLILLLPIVIAPRVLQLLDELMDSKTPAWRRALIATLILEALALFQVQVSVASALRCVVLASVFSTQGRAGGSPASLVLHRDAAGRSGGLQQEAVEG